MPTALAPSPARVRAAALALLALAAGGALGARPLAAQGGRGAGTTLLATATVMPPPFPGFAVRSLSAPVARRADLTMIEVATSVEVAGSTPYRVVLHHGGGGGSRGAPVRVWVRTHRGTFERLDGSAGVTVAGSGDARRTDLVFRIEADDPNALAGAAIPVACEVVAQTDDAASAYRFVVMLRGT